MTTDRATVLLAEDDPDDVLLTQIAFERARLANPLQVVRDGEEAIAYLKGTGKFANRAEFPMPSLLLLDLVMPLINGFEVLEWLREQQPGLNSLPVVVLTASETIHDIKLASQLGALSFLVKPIGFKDLHGLSSFLPATLPLANKPQGTPPAPPGASGTA